MDAALPHGPFATSKGEVGITLECGATVVRGKEEQRVLPHAHFLESVNDEANALIHGRDHPCHDTLHFVINLSVGVFPTRGSLSRRMHALKGQVEKEGIALVMLLQDGDGSVHEHLGGVGAVLVADDVAAIPEINNSVGPRCVRVVVLLAIQVAVEGVEATLKGSVLPRGQTQVPLAYHVSGIASLLKMIGHSPQLKRKCNSCGWHDVGMLQPRMVRIPASHQ
mmetsp:Transcript_3993/g.9287  ORF Transcript_3993/g.9287 Transcript_3993/m.9287 type:complete len:223 (+) Transcript_3993:865-1533(+)